MKGISAYKYNNRKRSETVNLTAIWGEGSLIHSMKNDVGTIQIIGTRDDIQDLVSKLILTKIAKFSIPVNFILFIICIGISIIFSEFYFVIFGIFMLSCCVCNLISYKPEMSKYKIIKRESCKLIIKRVDN